VWEATDANSFVSQSFQAYNFEVNTSSRIACDQRVDVRQQDLSRALERADHVQFMAGLSVADKAHVNSEMLCGASDWLDAVPSAANAMSPEEFITELKVRLLQDVFSQDSFCELCGDVMDAKGRHAATCPCGGDRTRRHNGVRDRICAFAHDARQRPEKEKPGLLQPSPEQPNAARRRPADVFLPSWLRGVGAALDIAITAPSRRDAVLEASRHPGAAATAYEHAKRTFLNTALDCQQQGFNFVPLVGEPSGGWGPSAQALFKGLAKCFAGLTGREAALELKEHRQPIGVFLRRANARAIFRRDHGNVPWSTHSAGSALAGTESTQ